MYLSYALSGKLWNLLYPNLFHRQSRSLYRKCEQQDVKCFMEADANVYELEISLD